jgi:hypothetical protein
MATGGFEVGKAYIQVIPSFDRVQRDIAQFVAKMRHIEVPVRVNPQRFQSDLDRAVRAAASGISVDLGSAKLDMTDAQRKISDIGRAKATVRVVADDRVLAAKLAEVNAKRIALVAKINLDERALQAKLDELDAKTVSVDVEIDRAKVEAQLTALDATRVRIEAQIDVDAGSALSELASVDAAVSRVDGRTAHVNVEPSGASRALGIFSLIIAGIAGIGYAAPAAAAALALIPAAISAAGQGVTALVAGFNGIGGAVKAMQTADDEGATKATANAKTRAASAKTVATATSALEGAQTAADRAAITGADQVAAARTGLASAQEGVLRAQETGLRHVQDAETALMNAQESARDAQNALNLARANAKERLDDLQLSLKGAALDEEAAAIALEKAQAKLAAVKAAGLGGLGLREADLAARQAAQSLAVVRERYADLQTQSAASAKTGVEGDKAVVAANKTVRDSAQRVTAAELNLTQARTDSAAAVAKAQAQVATASAAVGKAQQTAAWATADAAKAVADAQKRMGAAGATAGATGTAAMDKLHLAMAKLTPAGRSFATMLQKEVKPALRTISDGVQTAMLPGMETGLRKLLTLTPVVTTALADTGKVLGDLAVKAADTFTTATWQADFATIAANNTAVLRRFGDAGISVADAFRTILVASGPLLLNLSNVVAEATKTFAAFLDGKRATGELAHWFSEMQARLSELWSILVNVGKGLWDLAVALAPVGGALLKIIEALAQVISGFTNAHPVITQVITALVLLTTAYVYLGKSIGGIRSSLTTATGGFRSLGGATKAAATDTDGATASHGRLGKALGGLSGPMAGARSAMSSLGGAYRDSAGHAQTWMDASKKIGGVAAEPTGRLSALKTGLGQVGIAAVGAGGVIKKGLGGITNALGGPWVLAITGAILLIGLFTASNARASEKVAAQQEAVKNLAEEYRAAGGVINDTIRSDNIKFLTDKNVAANAAAAGSSFTEYALAVNGSKDALARLTESSDHALRSIGAQAGLTALQNDNLAGLGTTALATGKNYEQLTTEANKAPATFGSAATALTNLNQEQRDGVNAILNANGALGEQLKNNRAAIALGRLMESSLSGVTEKTIDQWSAATKLRDVTRELAEANLSLLDAQNALSDSQRSSAQAQGDYATAVQEHGAQSKEATAALEAVADAHRQEEHSILGVLDAAKRASEARNKDLPEAERQHQATIDLGKALFDLAKTYKGELTPAMTDSLAGFTAADAVAAGFTVSINELGRSIVVLPDGKTITISAATTDAGLQVADVTAKLQSLPPNTPLTVTALTGPAQEALLRMKYRIVELPDGTFTVFSNTDEGQRQMDAFVAANNGRPVALDATVALGKADAALEEFRKKFSTLSMSATLNPDGRIRYVNADGQTRVLGSVSRAEALGGILEFFAGGGFSGLNPMSSSVAEVVPPNTMRVIGDRTHDDEAFIPINQDARSIKVLAETAARMGFSLSPMALGGILAMAGGGITAPAEPLAPAGPVGLVPGQMTALAAETAILTAALVVLQAEINGVTVPALGLLEQHAGTLAVQTIQLLMAQLAPLRDGFALTTVALVANWATITTAAAGSTTAVVANWATMTTTANESVTATGGYLATLRAGLAEVGQVFAATATWVNDSWSKVREYAAAPTRDVLNGPFNAGLIAAWNFLDTSFSLGKHLDNVAVPFAEGGPVRGAGTGTSDSILTRLSNGEYVIPEAITRRIRPFLDALRAGQAEALQAAGYASGGIVADTGSQLNAAVARGQAFAAAQNGKPYIWGGVGPQGYDCSGLMSAVANVLLGAPNPYRRLGDAASAPWPGFVHGLSSAFAMGSSTGHTAGTLGGINVESTGDHVRFGGDAHGADDRQFPVRSSLPVVGGTFVSGGGAAFDPAALVATAFADTLGMIGSLGTTYAQNTMGSDGLGIARAAVTALSKFAVSKIAVPTTPTGPTGPISSTVKAEQDYAATQLARFGWGPEQLAPLIALWQNESRWDPLIVNDSSGAYGIPQSLPGNKMASAGADWRTNPATQINWGLDYIKGRRDYGSPSAAWAAWNARSPHWYDDGGWLPPGYSTVGNHTGKPEAILTQDQWNSLTTMASVHSGGGARSITVNARTDASPDHIAHSIDRHVSIGARL